MNVLSEALQNFTGLRKKLLTNLLGGDAKSAAPAELKQEPAPLPMSIIVDCDAKPIIPFGLYLDGKRAEHRKMGTITLEKREDGKLYANGKEVVLDLSPNQQNGRTIKGHQLRKEQKNKQVLNACIMDALRANIHLIPESWKKDEQGRIRYIFFWGTIFRVADGDLYVACLYWDGQWSLGYRWLDFDWDAQNPAASLAS